jgi:glycogen synthase
MTQQDHPRKILMTADSVGGVWDYSLQLAAALAPHDVQFALVVMGGKPSATQLREVERLPNVRLIGTDLKLEWMTDPAADLACANSLLLDLEQSFQPDVVHVNGYANAAAGFSAPVMVVAHSCVSSWWRACRREAPPAEWEEYAERLRRGVEAADIVVAPTSSHLRAFCQAHGTPAKVRVILNGRSRERYSASEKRMFALAAGRLWDEAKNTAALIEAANSVSFPLEIAGEGPVGSVPSNVSLLGRLGSDAMARKMGEAAVFVAPARYEPFGLAILEAAFSGCALVLGDIPSLRELWDGAALFVDPDDPKAIASALGGLLDRPARARAEGQKAFHHAFRYGADAMGINYLRLYGSLSTSSHSRMRAVVTSHCAPASDDYARTVAA